MRIWDLPPKNLCRQHLLAEHRELHGLWNILTLHQGKGGYSRHPETLRWVGKERALFARHEKLAEEFLRRGYSHRTPLCKEHLSGIAEQNVFISTPEEQKEILKSKGCACFCADQRELYNR